MATVLKVQAHDTETDDIVLFDELNMVKVHCNKGAYAIGDSVDMILECSEIRYVSEVDPQVPDSIITITASHGHKIIGCIIDRTEGLLQCGKFLFQMDPNHLHADMQNGCRVEWTCECVQIW